MKRSEKGGYRSIDYWIPLILFIVALVPRILNAFTVHYHHYISDSFQYVTIAENLFSLDGFFEEICHFPPGYPFLIKISFLLFGEENFVALRIVQSVISALVPVALYLVGKSWFGTIAGLLCAIPAIFFGPGIFYGSTLMSETLFVPLVALSMAALQMAWNRPTAHRLVALSTIAAWAILTRPIFAAFLPVIIGVTGWIIYQMDDPKLARRLLIAALAPIILIVGLWGLRNWIAYPEFVWIAPNTEKNLWIGNSPDATGTYNGVSTHPALEGADFWEQRNTYRRLAVESIRENPQRFLSLAITKLKYLWGKRQPWPLYGTNSLRFAGDLTCPILPAWAVQLGALVGLAIGMFRRKRAALLSVAAILSYCALIALAFGLPRFRLPLDPILLLWCGLGFYWVLLPLKTLISSALRKKIPALLLSLPLIVYLISGIYRIGSGVPGSESPILLWSLPRQYLENAPSLETERIDLNRDEADSVVIDLTSRYEGDHNDGVGELARVSFGWFDGEGEELKWWMNSDYWIHVPEEDIWIEDRIQVRIPEQAHQLRIQIKKGPSKGRLLLDTMEVYERRENPLFLNQWLPRLRRYEYQFGFFP